MSTPFTADQIRLAMPVGHSLQLEDATAGHPPQVQTWTVLMADATQVRIRFSTPGAEPREASFSWTELRDHAQFPADRTKVETGLQVDVPAGRMAVTRYTVYGHDGTVTTYDFAPDLPGPPVQMTVSQHGAAQQRLSLVRRDPVGPTSQ